MINGTIAVQILKHLQFFLQCKVFQVSTIRREVQLSLIVSWDLVIFQLEEALSQQLIFGRTGVSSQTLLQTHSLLHLECHFMPTLSVTLGNLNTICYASTNVPFDTTLIKFNSSVFLSPHIVSTASTMSALGAPWEPFSTENAVSSQVVSASRKIKMALRHVTYAT